MQYINRQFTPLLTDVFTVFHSVFCFILRFLLNTPSTAIVCRYSSGSQLAPLCKRKKFLDKQNKRRKKRQTNKRKKKEDEEERKLGKKKENWNPPTKWSTATKHTHTHQTQTNTDTEPDTNRIWMKLILITTLEFDSPRKHWRFGLKCCWVCILLSLSFS